VSTGPALNIHLVRHGHHGLVDRVLCGRMPGVQLDELGCDQMAITAETLRRYRPSAMQSSPQRRALQSAAIIANRCGCAVEIASGFDEIDMGSWTGAAFSELASDKKWRRWNARRGSARPPGGESMGEVQRRVIEHLEQLKHIVGDIVIVSHAEPIRAALMHYLAIPLDRFQSVQIDPASISTVRIEGSRRFVSCVNGKVSA
jgi:broad specificity phosphatase PhoE